MGVVNREQSSDELMVRDSKENVIKKENQDIEKVYEFSVQPKDDDKDIDKPDNPYSVFEDGH